MDAFGEKRPERQKQANERTNELKTIRQQRHKRTNDKSICMSNEIDTIRSDWNASYSRLRFEIRTSKLFTEK